MADSSPVALLPGAVTAAAMNFDAGSEAAWPAAAPPRLARASAEEISDEALVAAIRRGDQKLGRLLYARLSRVIDATLTRVLGPGQPDHDDWAQAAFEEVVRTIHKGQFQQRCSLTSWAASVACHIGLNAIRTRKTERKFFDRDEQTDEPSLAGSERDLERSLVARDELRQLRAELSQLSPGRAEAVLLHDALGYDLKEVAALTQSSVAAVQSRLVRGRKDLAERLAAAKTQERRS
ncbi:MAG TPA: RNA polymerase sigma factor [Polyangiaceae bacterium]